MTMTTEITADEYVRMVKKAEKAEKGHKYRNTPTEVDGIKFDSKAEARRYGELMLMMAAGEIGQVILQPRFVIAINGTKICTYVGDFEYHRRGVRVIEDVKGVKTPAYRIKKKLMLAVHGIDIEEIT